MNMRFRIIINVRNWPSPLEAPVTLVKLSRNQSDIIFFRVTEFSLKSYWTL